MSDSNKILTELSALRGHLEQLLRQDSSNKRAFDTLYKELDQYKSDFVFKFEKSVLLDLLSFYDSMIWFQSTLEKQNSDSKDNFSYLIDEFYELLRRRDVLPYPPSEELNRKHHRVIQLEDTDDAKKDKKVAQVLRRGFFRGDRSLRDEEIILYRYTPSDVSTEESTPESTVPEAEEAESNLASEPSPPPAVEETRAESESEDTDSQ
ncbi:MAG: nucleotide exchange factor GrpE [Myxococcota bacterium]|nr:nucleotide exchange factor GrpE [Myxococcota bacterium]